MKSGTIELADTDLGPGLCGIVRGIAVSMEHQGTAADLHELLGISSAAFRNYVFDPDINQHDETPRALSPYAAMFSNYGPWESIGYYTGWEARPVNGLSAVETMKVVLYEIEHGRPPVTLTPNLMPTMVTGYSVAVGENVVKTQAGDFRLSDTEHIQNDDEVFINWLLLVRPGETREWAATPTRQRIDVLRWFAAHTATPKEFFQETRENYATGLAGIRRFQRTLDGLTDPFAVELAERYVRELHAARIAAAQCLRAWSGEVAEALDAPEVATELNACAAAYDDVARVLAEGANFVDAFAEVEPLEAQALDRLTAAARHFPSPFEA